MSIGKNKSVIFICRLFNTLFTKAVVPGIHKARIPPYIVRIEEF